MDIPDFDLKTVASATPGRHKLSQRWSMQQRHMRLMHAYKCQQREAQSLADGQVWQCPLARCKKMKGVLNHMMACPSEKKCTCSMSRHLMKRFSHCKKEDCPVCVQRKAWQMRITAEQRRHVVDLLMQVQDSIFDTIRDIPYAQEKILLSTKMMENDMYKMADTLSDYYRMLAVRKWEMEMNIEKNRKQYEEYDETGFRALLKAAKAWEVLRTDRERALKDLQFQRECRISSHLEPGTGTAYPNRGF